MRQLPLTHQLIDILGHYQGMMMLSSLDYALFVGRYNAAYLYVASLGRVVGVPGVRPPHRLPLEPPVLDLDVAAGRAVTRVVQAAHFGPH